MTMSKCPQCERKVSRDAAACPLCGYPLKANNGSSPEIRTDFLKLTELLGFLSIALALLFFVVAYIMFFAGKAQNGILCSLVGLALLVWGCKPFKGLFTGS